MKKFLHALSLVTFGLLSITCSAGDPPAAVYVAGTHYEVLPTPVHTSDPSRIEVAEFFWYGCPHCYHFEPSINAWLKKTPKDVNFVRVPAMWHPDMELHAKMYYTAQQLKVLDELHEIFFKSMQLGKMPLNTQDEIASLFVGQGVSREAFDKTFNSFGTDSMVKQAQARANGSRVRATPEVVVNGKYRVSARTAGSQTKILDVVDFLIRKEREATK